MWFVSFIKIFAYIFKVLIALQSLILVILILYFKRTLIMIFIFNKINFMQRKIQHKRNIYNFFMRKSSFFVYFTQLRFFLCKVSTCYELFSIIYILHRIECCAFQNLYSWEVIKIYKMFKYFVKMFI